jgi:hypothetical protein
LCDFGTASASMLTNRLGREFNSEPTARRMGLLIGDAYGYLTDNGIDTKLPLLEDAGAIVNALTIDQVKNVVHLHTPVFRNTVYQIADPWGVTFRRSKSP